ncbi:DUF4238 domain-containing protein [candidate division WOR-3 bacterium]|uniref:DUF4238 domain-containing protein n=1 Tax=candidate division WOR-3 bacterium TaxID=2052148 RepID=A0A9D5KCS9_UNCW3|nr:DUF4238 domain-containing protein [candidate division WOR-3 bacterium]MBD3365256.1 DUF4238 domain-containing protein [candidate division WOR-3 bacterium]
MPDSKSKQQDQTRKQHYIPKFYLDGFTSEDDYLWLFDLKTGKKTRAHPKTVAWQKDFYRLKTVKVGANLYENAFATLEKDAAKVIKKITEEETLPEPNSEEFTILMNFVALMVVRTPKMWRSSDEASKEMFRMMIRGITRTEEIWKAQTRKWKKEGFDVNDFNREDMAEIADEKKYNILVPKTEYLSMIIDQLDVLISILGHRKWFLACVCDERVNFVTSDNPVCLDWTVPMDSFYSPGFAHVNTIVNMPLTKRILMFGLFKSNKYLFRLKNRFKMGKIIAPFVNSSIIRHSDRFLFSSKDDFVWHADGKSIESWGELRRRITARERETG